MILRKRCSKDEPPTLPNGDSNPLYCPTTPRCAHHWHYHFQINGPRYRASTETADKHTARDIEATEPDEDLARPRGHSPAAGHYVPEVSPRRT
jgi:hypothetical protein